VTLSQKELWSKNRVRSRLTPFRMGALPCHLRCRHKTKMYPDLCASWEELGTGLLDLTILTLPNSGEKWRLVMHLQTTLLDTNYLIRAK